MQNSEPPLKVGDYGSYGELATRVMPEDLRAVFMPSLAALLDGAEEIKGAPLTEEEVLRIRDGAKAVVIFADVAAATEAERGYTEVDPANAWESWQTLRDGHKMGSG